MPTNPFAHPGPPALNPTLLNQTLSLALDWGADFLQPTQPRMHKLHPAMTQADLDAYDAAARAVMNKAFAILYDKPSDDRDALARMLSPDFPWLNADNLARLHSQGMYYAMK